MCLNGIKGSKKDLAIYNAKITGENNVYCIFYADCKFVLGKQAVNCGFYEDVIDRVITQVYCIRPEFQESGPCYLLHESDSTHFSVVDSEFYIGKMGDLDVIPFTLFS